MAVLVDKNTKVICQGFTGSQGTFHSEQAIAYGTKMVGGVTPGQGRHHASRPAGVRHRGRGGRRRPAPTPRVIYVPPPFAADAILEAIDAGIPLIVCITEGIPVLDMVRVKRTLAGSQDAADRAELPGRHHARRMQDRHHAGPHPQARQDRHRLALRHADLRGGGADHGGWARPDRPASASAAIRSTAPTSSTCLEMFLADPETEGIVMIGEIGGDAEEEAAEFIKASKTKKPVVGFIAGRTAPPGRRMGHAGAIISGGHDTAAYKVEALRAAGIRVADSPAALGEEMLKAMKG